MQNLVEYYDELYPVTQDSIDFINYYSKVYSNPVKIIQIGSGSGTLAMSLAKAGNDVTGIEISQPLLDSSTLKRRTQLTSIRFFNLSVTEMGKYLGKNFYNLMLSLNNRLVFTKDEETARNFFLDSKKMLSEKGTLIIQLYNYEYFERTQKNPSNKSSLRADLRTFLDFHENGEVSITQDIEAGNSRMLSVLENEMIYPLTKNDIQSFAKDAGFSNINFYSDFKKSQFTENSEELICVLN